MSFSKAVRNPRSYLGRRQRMYRALLFDPERFYDEYTGSRGLLREALLVAVVGLVGSFGTIYAVQTLLSGYGGTTQQVEMSLWGNGLSPFIGAFVLWIGFAAVLYAVSWLYSTAGTFYVLAKKTGWAMVPLVFWNAIQAVAFAVTAYNVEVESEVQTGTNDRIVAYIWEQVAHEPAVLGAYGLGVVFAIWCGYVAAFGVADVRDLERSEALRVVAVPVVLYALYIGYQIVTAL